MTQLKNKQKAILIIAILSFFALSSIAYACLSDSGCSADGYYCNSNTREYRNYYCSLFMCQYSKGTTQDCTKQTCKDSTHLFYNGYCSGADCWAYTKTCTWKCQSDVCYDCKANGNTCSAPATSTSECCSGNCQQNGKCGTDTCTNDCSTSGATKCLSSTTRQTCGSYDSDVCLEWGNSFTCSYGCSGGSCNPDPCAGVTCNNYCSGETKKYSGSCSGGSCSYSSYDCNNDNYYGSYENYCSGNDVRKHRKYYDNTCSSGSCIGNGYTWYNDQLVQTCAYQCSGGSCICKNNGDTCSPAGSSTAQCCSGTCGLSGKCVASADQCYTLGAKQCSGSDVQECQQDTDNIWKWKTLQSCTNGCYNNKCNNCIPGSTRCTALGFQETCVFSLLYGAYDWGNSTTCPLGCSNNKCNTCKSNGQTCSMPGSSGLECCSGTCQIDGKCGTDTCTNDCSTSGATKCLDSNIRQTCGSYDSDICLEWGNGFTCASGCYNNKCNNCIPGSTRCTALGFQETCVFSLLYGAYDWGNSTTCPLGCSNNKCNTCKSNGQTCSMPGSSGLECCSGTCGLSGKCVASADQCYTLGAKQCSGNISQECQQDTDNIWKWKNNQTCTDGCSNGSCNTCKTSFQTCSTPGTSTAECCSGICGFSGKCIENVDQCYTLNAKQCNGNISQACQQDLDYIWKWKNVQICISGCINGNCKNNSCSIKDGSSWDCDCNSDTECPTGYYCNQVSGPDACEPINYQNECSNFNDYFCENGDVYFCNNNGKYYQKKLIEQCNIGGKYCDPIVVDGTQKCSQYSNQLDLWIDYANTGVDVNKQIGDKLKINIYGKYPASVNLWYDSNIFQGNCPIGSWSISTGTNNCDLVVKDYANYGTTKIKINNDKIANVKIIEESAFIEITDSEKLYQRYPYEENGVKALLKQAYTNAKDGGVVYDLSWYKTELGVNNPFNNFLNYNEKITQPSMMDNSYSLAVSQFVHEKCGYCKDVMIIGDDFVVPSYRREIPKISEGWFFSDIKSTQNIYTDAPYSNKKALQFSNYYEMFKIDGNYQGKQVLLILPDNINQEQLTQVERLKQALVNQGYNPHFSNISGKDAYCVDQRWFADVNGKTLIIIGTEENNNAFKCMPFVAGDINRDAVFIQPNVWDNKEYAIVINTDNPNVTGAFASMIEDGTIVQLKGESAYWFHVGTQVAGYTAMGVGIAALIFFSGGTATPAIILSAGIILDGIADASDSVDSCVVNYQGAVWCGTSIGFVAIPLVSSAPAKKVIRNFDDTVLNNRLAQMFEPVDDLINKYFKKLRSSKSIGDEAFEESIQTVQDNIYVAKGSKKIFGELSDQADIDWVLSSMKNMDNFARAKFIKRLGECEESFELGENYIKKVEFRKLPKDTLGRTKDGIIQISDSADSQMIIDNVIGHEYSHNYITKSLGERSLWDLTDNPSANSEVLTEFDEYLTEVTAKSKLNSHFLLDLKDIKNADDFEIIYLASIGGDVKPDELSRILAESKSYDRTLYNQIKNRLESINTPYSTKVIELADQFDSSKNLLGLSDDLKKIELDNIISKRNELYGVWPR